MALGIGVSSWLADYTRWVDIQIRECYSALVENQLSICMGFVFMHSLLLRISLNS